MQVSEKEERKCEGCECGCCYSLHISCITTLLVFIITVGVYDPATKYAEFAYDRQYTLFDMKTIFAEPPPQ